MITLDGLELPRDYLWSDEFDWQPVEQSVEPTLTGALIVQSQARSTGRSITLQPEDDNSAAMSRATLQTLRGWAAVPGKVMELVIAGVSYQVIFRHHDKPAIQARPWIHYSPEDMAPEDLYLVTLKFMVYA